MGDSTGRRPPTPHRSSPRPESYAIHVDGARIRVWQYCVDPSDPDGEWRFVERLARDDDPLLSVTSARLGPPSADGCWIYSASYDCELDCE